MNWPIAPALMERVVAGTLQLLRDTEESPLCPTERTHHFPVVEALPARRGLSAHVPGDAANRSGRHARRAERRLSAADALPAGGGLELMDESRAEIDIGISRAMQLIDTTAERKLRELQTFTSTLVGQTHVSTESNPLRPLAYATALWEAACAASPVPAPRTTLLRVSAGVAAGLLK